MVREESRPAASRRVPAVYLVPFHRAELSLAGPLLRPADHRPRPAAALPDVDWDRALDWLRSGPAPSSPPSRRTPSGWR